MKRLFIGIIVILASQALTLQRTIVQASGTSGGNANIAQGVMGFGTPSSSTAPEPCLGSGIQGTCYGVPADLFVLPNNLLVTPGTAGVYYSSLQTADLSGTADTTFELFESGVNVLQFSVTGATVNANSKMLIAQAGTIPAGPYEGPATLTATTTVTPDGGGTPVTLKASTQMFILPVATDKDGLPSVITGAMPRMAQGLVGFGVTPGPAPCVGIGLRNVCFGLPKNVIVLPQDLMQGPSLGGVCYAFLQTTNAYGSGSTLFQFVQNGKVLLQFTDADENIQIDTVTFVGATTVIPANASVGPATVIATTTLTPRNGPAITVKGGITLQIFE